MALATGGMGAVRFLGRRRTGGLCVHSWCASGFPARFTPTGGVDGHADVAPGVPADRDHRRARDGVRLTAVLCEHVEECVRRTVVRLAEPAGDGGKARTEREEVQRTVLEHALERERAENLGCQDGFCFAPLPELDRSASGNSRRVDDAVNVAETALRFANHLFHLDCVGHVRGGAVNLGTQRLELPHTEDCAVDAILRRKLLEQLVPLRAMWNRGAPGENQLRADSLSDVLRQRQPDPSKAAGDQVRTAGPELDPPLGCLCPSLRVTLEPPCLTTVRHIRRNPGGKVRYGRLFVSSGRLRDEPSDLALDEISGRILLLGTEWQIYVAALDARILPRDDAARTE